jgi:UDP-N-acetylmuramoylalanine-D-glutamate ligase
MEETTKKVHEKVFFKSELIFLAPACASFLMYEGLKSRMPSNRQP